MPRITTAAAAWQRAAECEALAAKAPTEELRKAYIALRDEWTDLGNKLHTVESRDTAPPTAKSDDS